MLHTYSSFCTLLSLLLLAKVAYMFYKVFHLLWLWVLEAYDWKLLCSQFSCLQDYMLHLWIWNRPHVTLIKVTVRLWNTFKQYGPYTALYLTAGKMPWGLIPQLSATIKPPKAGKLWQMTHQTFSFWCFWELQNIFACWHGTEIVSEWQCCHRDQRCQTVLRFRFKLLLIANVLATRTVQSSIVWIVW